MKREILVFVSALAVSFCFSVAGNATDTKGTAVAPDNTKVNKEHKEMSADQQKENTADRKMTQDIRRAIVKNKSLSQYAKNVKIITVNGAVTLKGPVRSEKEKSIVEQAAAKVAGKGNVTSELEVAPPKSKTDKDAGEKSGK